MVDINLPNPTVTALQRGTLSVHVNEHPGRFRTEILDLQGQEFHSVSGATILNGVGIPF